MMHVYTVLISRNSARAQTETGQFRVEEEIGLMSANGKERLI